jgi:hypothetical protein
MLKNIARLECMIGEKVYHLMCDNDSPLDQVKEALFQFQKYIGQIEDSAKAAQEKSKQDVELVKEEPKAE